MAHLLIWGKAREMLAGELPAGAAEEVQTLGALLASLDGKGAALVLADAERLEAERPAVEAWARGNGAYRPVMVAVTDPADGDRVLQRFPFVDDVVARPVSPGHLRLKVERAFDIVRNRRVIRQLQEALSRKGDELSELNKIGVALSAERDIDKLLDLILQKSREITQADAGSLYLVERGREHEETRDDQLRFKLAQNDSVAVPFEEFTIPLDESSIAGYAALSGEPVNVADAYRLPPDSPYQISRAWDERSGYRTKSMLAVPMRDHENAVIGVVQLINKKRQPASILRPVTVVEEEVIPFTSVDQELAGSLASQAAVAFENAKLLQDIRHLFDSFVHAAVTAIEQRDPTTSGHSEGVAILTVGLAGRVDAASSGPFADFRLSRDQMEELRYASLLHDFGKVGVREKVLIKGKKLYVGELTSIRQRFAFIRKDLEAEHLRTKLERVLAGSADAEALAVLDAAHAERDREIERVLKAVLEANEPTVKEEENFRTLMDMAAREFSDDDSERYFPLEEWARGPFLSSRELAALSIRKGSLSTEEREQIQSHVTHTWEFLSKIPWTGEFRRIPEIAYAHHEKLDGSGYPRRLKDSDIPLQSRMMTISDIYDALVAWDRPYKPAVSTERALEILTEEASLGKLDQRLLAIFLEARIWDGPDYRQRLLAARGRARRR